MDSQNLKQRASGDSASRIDDADVDDKNRSRRDYKKAIATKRGVASLTAALSIPLTLTVIAISLASTSTASKTKTPFWFPATWFVHAASAAAAMAMGLAAWLVWAKGGFHASPTALYLYLAQFVLGLVWDPLVLGSGSSRIGLVLCAGMFGSLVGCHQAFKEINLLAAHLVKGCLAWTAFLGIVNLTLVYL